MSVHLDKFYKEVVDKISLDFDKDEVRDVTSGIEILLNRFIGTLQEEYSSYDIKSVVACGSMAEGTKILTKELEYDFLAVINTLPECGELSYIPSCDGSMQILNENLEKGILTTSSKTFLTTICDVINKKCKENGCRKNGELDFEVIKTLDNGCSYCTLKMKAGNLSISLSSFPESVYKLKFQWFGVSRIGRPRKYNTYSRSRSDKNTNWFLIESYLYESNFKCEEISVDFHPVLRVDRNNIKCSYSHEQSGKLPDTNVFLFPSSVTTHDTTCELNIGCWRISTYDQELKVLREATEEHRQAYMILKFILERSSEYDEDRRETNSILKNIGSFAIKCAIIQHIQNCTSTKPAIAVCVKETLTFLSKSLKAEELPSVFTGYNILKSNPHLWQDENRHQRCQIIGDSLQAIIDILYTGLHKNSEDCMVDLHLIQWTLQDTKHKYVYPVPSSSIEISYQLVIDVERFKNKLNNVVRCRKYTDTNMYLYNLAVIDFIRSCIGIRIPFQSEDGQIMLGFQSRLKKLNPVQTKLDAIKASPRFNSVVTYYILKLLVKLIICESHLRALTLF